MAALGDKDKLSEIPGIFFDFDKSKVLRAVGIDANSGVSEEMLIDALDYAARENQVLMIYAHKPSKAPQQYEVSIELLDVLCKEIKKRKMKFYLANDLSAF